MTTLSQTWEHHWRDLYLSRCWTSAATSWQRLMCVFVCVCPINWMESVQSSWTFPMYWSKVPEVLPEQLHQLYLESNAIDSLPEGFLGRFNQLQYIRMSHNQLTDKGIPANTFNVTGLVELDLSFNKLERIPPVSTTLQHFYLQANQIKGKP